MDRRHRVQYAGNDERRDAASTPQSGGCKRVAAGWHADVVLCGEALDEYEKLLRGTDTTSRKSAAQLPRYFGRYVNRQPLSDQMFKALGRQKQVAGTKYKSTNSSPISFAYMALLESTTASGLSSGLHAIQARSKTKQTNQKLEKLRNSLKRFEL